MSPPTPPAPEILPDSPDARLNQRLARTGLRFTPQRRLVYLTLLHHHDHPTAEDVFIRAKNSMPEISIATVYNCLDTLAQCGLVRQVNHERGATRYCSNLDRHHHFYCTDCGGTFDIEAPPPPAAKTLHLPPGFHIHSLEVSMRGTCATCSTRKKIASDTVASPLAVD